MPKVSIIMPARNSASWIKEAIDSVIEQTYSDWELLIIDDFSNDSTLEIARRGASSDSRIRVIASSYHSGPAHIRNVGLRESGGDYIAFIDGDDLWPRGQLEYLINIIGDNRIAIGRIIKFDDGEEGKIIWSAEKSYIHKPKEREISGIEAMQLSLYQHDVEPSLCGRLFRKSLFAGKIFKEGELYEDLNMFHQLLTEEEKVVISNRPTYLYRQRAGSIIHTFGPSRLIVLEVTQRISNRMAADFPVLLPAAIDRQFSANYNMLQLLLKYGLPEKSEAAEKIKTTSAFIKTHASSELKNPRVRFKNRLGALGALLLPEKIWHKLLSIL